MCDLILATKQAVLLDQMKRLLKQRAEVDGDLLLHKARRCHDAIVCARETRRRLAQEIKHVRDLLRSRRTRPLLIDEEKREQRKAWSKQYYLKLCAKARAFDQLEVSRENGATQDASHSYVKESVSKAPCIEDRPPIMSDDSGETLPVQPCRRSQRLQKLL